MRKGNVKRIIVFFIMFLWMCGIAAIYPDPLPAADLGLEDLYLLALERSEKIKYAEQNLLLAEEAKNKKRSVLMPRLTASGSFMDFTEMKKSADTVISPTLIFPGTVIQPDNMGVWGVRLDQAITLDGKEIRDFQIARENISKQEKEIYAAKEDYMMNVAISYYEVLRAQKNVEIADAAVNRLTLYRDAARKRLKIGEVTKTVLLRADGELSGALSDRIRARNALDLFRAVLARTVGISTDFRLREKLYEEMPLTDLEAYFRTAMEERADLQSAKIDKKMTEDQIRVAKGGYWPIFSVAGVYGRVDQHPAASTTNRESIFGQVALNFPFFEGGLRMAEVREAIIKDKQAQLRLDDLQKTIRIEVESAYVELKNQRGIIKSLEDQLTYASENYQAVTRQFDFGLANSIDVMDANTLLVSAERQLATAVYTHQVFQLRIKRTTGRLFQEILALQQAEHSIASGEKKGKGTVNDK
jgi:outer membrane protein